MENLLKLVHGFDLSTTIALLILTLAGFFVSLWIDKTKRDPKETITNFSIFAVGQFLKYTIYRSLAVGGLLAISRLLPYHIPVTPISCFALMIIADFSFYWLHRIEHEIQILWAIHSVHHSSKEFNTSTALRLGWLTFFPTLMWSLVLVLIGFHPLMAVLAEQIVLVYQYWIHTESIGKMGWVDKIFNSPSNHRVHHASNPEYIDKNYGGILMIWDWLFGTYTVEKARPRFGLVEPITSQNPFVINFEYLFKVLRKAFASRSLSRGFLILLRNPNTIE